MTIFFLSAVVCIVLVMQGEINRAAVFVPTHHAESWSC